MSGNKTQQSKPIPPCKQLYGWQRATAETNKKRQCHDCGKPTYNYRCDKCWEKLRDNI